VFEASKPCSFPALVCPDPPLVPQLTQCPLHRAVRHPVCLHEGPDAGEHRAILHGLLHLGLGPEGAEPPIVGFDVAVAGDDGKLVTVLGFLDKVPG